MSDGENNVGSGIYEVKYTFTREELRELGLRLAAKAQEIYNQKAAKKAAASAAAAAIQQLEDDAAKLVQKLNQLSETRTMECRILYHHPRQGMKTVERPDTGEQVCQEPMSEAEMQSSFVFIDAPGRKEPKLH